MDLNRLGGKHKHIFPQASLVTGDRLGAAGNKVSRPLRQILGQCRQVQNYNLALSQSLDGLGHFPKGAGCHEDNLVVWRTQTPQRHHRVGDFLWVVHGDELEIQD